MKKRRGLCAGVLCIVCIALVGLLALGGCQAKEETVYREVNLPKNDGQPAKLVIGGVPGSGDDGAFRRNVMEIIEKYRADYPNTQVEVVVENQEPRQAVGMTAPDIELIWRIDDRDRDGWMDLSVYEDAWRREGTISNAASRIMHCEGGEGIYVLPAKYEQMMLYYRLDWFEEFNADKTTNPEKVIVTSWDRFFEVGEKLGDRGRVVIDEQVLPYLFDALVWSQVSVAGISDLAAAYYTPSEVDDTVFTLGGATWGGDMYEELLTSRLVRPGEELQAFIDGEAGMFIGTSLDVMELAEQMPEGTWKAVGLPRGNYGSRVVPLLNWAGWAVNAGTEEPEKAAHFLWYLTNADNNTHMAVELMEYGVRPIYREVEEMEPSLRESCWAGELELLTTSVYLYASGPELFHSGEPVGAEVTILSQQLERGEITVRQMLDALDEKYTRLLEDYISKGNTPPWMVDEEETP